MQVLFFLKLFGARLVAAELADVLAKHVSAAGYATIGAAFAAGAKGCQDQAPAEVAQAITDALFAIK